MATPDTNREARVYSGGDGDDYLAALGLRQDLLWDSLAEGVRALRNTSDHHPPTAPGYYLWAETIAALRRKLEGTGEWRIANPKNRPLIINGNTGVSVTAAGGNAATGTESMPNVARRKGQATRERYVPDQLELPLFLRPAGGEDYDRSVGDWIFLYHLDPHGARAELSLPRAFTVDGYVDSWRTRVLLEPRDEYDQMVRELPDEWAGDDVDFRLQEG
ncbi:hypothetical protein [Corynebacterium guangdongense]|uniref:Uncharacterized protein n=1 Tax=Corynebacterium guangdongense TaxID=1783348 RepID=A0ABU1ZU69_9CORY|nr:hypothetical protein [Corynebacterium guangdongense]MDR7328340.1 hypothetical protein [Corynebacterium guangdongense]WJZ16917.1 hypothetical protein CGUA_01585 [Corynebacterium guangdongense]